MNTLKRICYYFIFLHYFLIHFGSPISLTNAWLVMPSAWSFLLTPTISNVMAPFVAPKTMMLYAISCLRPQSSTVFFYLCSPSKLKRLVLLVYLHEVDHLIYGGCSFLPKLQCFTLFAAMGPSKLLLANVLFHLFKAFCGSAARRPTSFLIDWTFLDIVV